MPAAPGSVVQYDAAAPGCLAALPDVDAILVLGGGVPAAADTPPVYVQLRCDAAEAVYKAHVARGGDGPNVLMLSAGTAHLPQLLSADGLPVWESTASAAYLLKRGVVPPEKAFAETTSYDTISNAYFARTSFTDVAGWRRLLVVTNHFHMARTKAIFDWIFHAPRGADGAPGYELYYLSCDDVGLSADAVAARGAHEARGERNVRDRLAPAYRTLHDVLTFLTTKHDFYTAEKLGTRGRAAESSATLKASYGGAADAPPLAAAHVAVPALCTGALFVAWAVGSLRGRGA